MTPISALGNSAVVWAANRVETQLPGAFNGPVQNLRYAGAQLGGGPQGAAPACGDPMLRSFGSMLEGLSGLLNSISGLLSRLTQQGGFCQPGLQSPGMPQFGVPAQPPGVSYGIGVGQTLSNCYPLPGGLGGPGGPVPGEPSVADLLSGRALQQWAPSNAFDNRQAAVLTSLYTSGRL